MYIYYLYRYINIDIDIMEFHRSLLLQIYHQLCVKLHLHLFIY